MTVWCNLFHILNRPRMLRLAGLFLIIVALITTLSITLTAHAAPNTTKTVNFQGRLTSATGTTVPDGYYNMQFKIYQDGTGKTAGNPGGTLRWTESYVNNGGTEGVQVRNGYFTVNLGSATPFGTSVDWDQDTLWLSMNIAGSNAACSSFGTAPCVADGEMLPMSRITATPYAINSGMLGGKVADNFVQLGQGVQTDVSTNSSSIFINKTGTGNLMQLQSSGKDAFTITDTGSVAFGSKNDHTITVTTAAADTAGKKLTVTAGGGGAGASGGDLVLQGGGAGSSSANGVNGANVIAFENFESQPNGTAMSISNTIFETVFTNGSATFSNEWSINGGLSGKFVSQANAYERFTARDIVASRWYMMLPNHPTTNTSIGEATSGAGIAAQLALYTNGTVRQRNGGIADGPATSTLPVNTPIRVEWKIDNLMHTQEAQFYWGSNLHGATPNTTTSTANYTGGAVSALSTSINIASTGFTMYVDEWAYGADWIGPLHFSTSNGGNVQIDAGAKAGGGSGGSIFIGASNAQSITIGSTSAPINQDIRIGTNNTAGSTSNVIIGSGESASGGTTTLQAKNSVVIKTNGVDRATFSDTTNTVYFGNGVAASNPDNYTLQGTNSTANGVSGGSLTVQGGNATTGNTNGGNVTVSGGKGNGTGADGLVVLTTPTFSTSEGDANCYTSNAPVNASCTITDASVNKSSAVIIGFTATGQTATLPDPTIKTAGRVMNIIASGNSSDFTLATSGPTAVTMSANTAVTLLWNGSAWISTSSTSSGGLQGARFSPQSATGSDSAFAPELDAPSPETPAGPGAESASSGDNTPLLQAGKANSPILGDHDSLLGSMYYDTTLGKLQCYEANGWGACDASPDTFVTLSPEYANAVTHGSGIGTLSSDLCSDALNINDGSSNQASVCGLDETYNFYNWTSPETAAQTRSFFVTYQLPATFKEFIPDMTSVTGRTNSNDATVSYQIYRNNKSASLTPCGTLTTVSTGTKTTWQKVAATGQSDPSTCAFAAGDSIVIRANLTAAKDAHTYISNIGFVFSNN